jgi:hypothetical protein
MRPIIDGNGSEIEVSGRVSSLACVLVTISVNGYSAMIATGGCSRVVCRVCPADKTRLPPAELPHNTTLCLLMGRESSLTTSGMIGVLWSFAIVDTDDYALTCICEVSTQSVIFRGVANAKATSMNIYDKRQWSGELLLRHEDSVVQQAVVLAHLIWLRFR